MKAALTSILAGIAVLALNLGGAPQRDLPAPSGAEIDAAVAVAQAQADLH